MLNNTRYSCSQYFKWLDTGQEKQKQKFSFVKFIPPAPLGAWALSCL